MFFVIEIEAKPFSISPEGKRIQTNYKLFIMSASKYLQFYFVLNKQMYGIIFLGIYCLSLECLILHSRIRHGSSCARDSTDSGVSDHMGSENNMPEYIHILIDTYEFRDVFCVFGYLNL